MARRYGKLNKYDSRLRRCAISGFRFYESEMVKFKGLWIHPKYLDEDGVPNTRTIGAPNLLDLAPYQSYWVLDDDGNLEPRDITMVDESRAYSWWETDSGGNLIPKISYTGPEDHWENDSTTADGLMPKA